MKLLLITLGIVALLNPAGAQITTDRIAADSETPAATGETNLPPKGPTEIFSDSGNFNLKTHVAVYSGNVHVTDPQMKLTCELLTASVPEGGGRVDQIIAETNVVIDAIDEEGKPIHATSDRAVYSYKVENSITNETIVLTGNPRVERESGSNTGDKIIWDRQRNQFTAIGHQTTTFRQPLINAGTNKPPAVATPTNSHP